MFIVTKIALKRQLKKSKADRDIEKVMLLEQVLEDDDLLQLVHEAQLAEYDYERAREDHKSSLGNPFQDFLQWLIGHPDKVLKFILVIIQILAIVQPAPDIE